MAPTATDATPTTRQVVATVTNRDDPPLRPGLFGAEMMRRIYLSVALMLASSYAFPRMLNADCSPAGVSNKVKAMVSPSSFWKSALISIDREIEAEYTRIRLNRIQDSRDRANASFDAQEMKAAGIPVYSDPALNRELMEGEAFLRRLDAESLQKTKEWAARCRPYVTKALSEL